MLKSHHFAAATAAAATMLAPLTAHALVIIWNPGKLEVTVDGASEASIEIDSLTYVPCDGAAVTEEDFSGDLVAGLLLDPPSPEICSMTLTPSDDVVISGTNGNGPFEITVSASEFSFDGEDLPKSLPFNITFGTVPGPVMLNVE
ncbi:MAG: hypothetical protein AAGA48_03960 [Myxococcota bacterium]